MLGIDAGGSKTQVGLWRWEQALELHRHYASENESLQSAMWRSLFKVLILIRSTLSPLTSGLPVAGTSSYQTQLSTARFLEETQVIMGMAGLDTANDFRRAELWLQTALLQLGVTAPGLNCCQILSLLFGVPVVMA